MYIYTTVHNFVVSKIFFWGGGLFFSKKALNWSEMDKNIYNDY